MKLHQELSDTVLSFFYQINGIIVLFEFIEEKNKWNMIVYKVGVNGGFKTLFQKAKKNENYSPLKHFSEALKKFRNRKIA